MLLFCYIQLYHRHKVGLGVVDVLFLVADKPFFSIVMKYPSSLVLTDQSLSLRVLSVSHMLMLIARLFSPKVSCIYPFARFRSNIPPPWCGGVVFGVYILWVSNGAPRRPLDASKGRPSLTSYNEIVSVPL
jgi:hypothetical protein